MFTVLLSIHCLLSLFLVGLVLMQQGKGADLGATLSGGSNTVFGAAGAADLLTKLTTGTAVAFMITSVMLVRSYNAVGDLAASTDIMEGSLFTEADEVAKKPEVADFENLPTDEEVAADSTSKKVATGAAVTEGESASGVIEASQGGDAEASAGAQAEVAGDQANQEGQANQEEVSDVGTNGAAGQEQG